MGNCVNFLIIMDRRFLYCSLPVALALLAIRPAVAQGEQGVQSVNFTPTNASSSAVIAPVPVLTTTPALQVASNAPSDSPSLKSTQTPVVQQPAERSSYSSIRVDGPYIALTFDDGPHPTLTPKLLDILKERHIHVTFFVLGQMVKDHPEILVREAAEGHEIGNHTWDHLALTKVVSREGGLTHEIADTSELIKETIGKAPTILRPPYGATNPRLSRAIEKEYGMKVILWSVDPDDWKDPGAEVVEQRIIAGWKGSGGTKPGAIILAHDIHKGTVQAMPALLDALLAKGYKFVTLSELMALESKNPIPSPTASAQNTPHPKTK